MQMSKVLFAAGIQLLACVALGSTSHAFDLNGAWTTTPDVCDKVFAKTGNTISFRRDSDLYGDGFIVDENVIVAPQGKCTIKTKREEVSTMQIEASCSSEIMVDQERFNVKVVNDDTILRIFPSIQGSGGIEASFNRCKFKP